MTRTWPLNAALLLGLGAPLAGCPMDDDPPTDEVTTDEPDPSGPTGAPSMDDPTIETSGSSSSGSTSTDEDTGSSETGAPLFSVSGTVSRSATLPKDRDGVGTLVVGAFATCDLMAPVVLGAAIVPNADLSTEGASVEFSIEPLMSGPVFLVSFLDDDGNLDPENPLPGPGDPVLAEVAGDGVLTCVEVEVDDADVAGVEIDLNEIAMPPR